MTLYLTIIFIAMTIIAAINILLGTADWYYVVIAVVFCTLLQIALDGLFAFIINKIPDRWFSVDNKHYNVSDTEIKLYKKLGVRKWKDKVPDLGGIGGFSKRAVKEPDNPKFFEQFIIECNKGVLTHRIGYFIGFLAMLTLPNMCSFTIALPVAIVNLILNILPTVVLRYNTPKLKAALKHLKRLQEKNKASLSYTNNNIIG